MPSRPGVFQFDILLSVTLSASGCIFTWGSYSSIRNSATMLFIHSAFLIWSSFLLVKSNYLFKFSPWSTSFYLFIFFASNSLHFILIQKTYHLYIYPTLPHEQNVTQGQFLRGHYQFWTHMIYFPWQFAIPRLMSPDIPSYFII